jgi:hypothetical protein
MKTNPNLPILRQVRGMSAFRFAGRNNRFSPHISGLLSLMVIGLVVCVSQEKNPQNKFTVIF